MTKIKLFLLLVLVTLVSPTIHAQQADNYPPDDVNVTITSTNLPIVWIEVDNAMILKDERITARMKIIHNGEGQLNYADTIAHPGQHIDYEGYIALRYRGNSSFSMSDKKPYSFKTINRPLENGGTKERVDILGMGKDNEWALLAPYSDRSLMRDVLAFEISKPWMEYTPEGRFCEMFLDGTYYGIYVLTEVVSKGKNRLNLDDPGEEGDELTGGYLLEVDRQEGNSFASKYPPVDMNGNPCGNFSVYIQHKIPDDDDITEAQIEYSRNRVYEMEDALASPNFCDPVNGYRKYIDEMSFIDYQLIMELSRNVDAYRLSGKFFKRRDSQDERFKMVVWDMNLAFGNCYKYNTFRSYGWIYQSNGLMYTGGEDLLIPFWWYKLNKDPEYTAHLKERWAQYRLNNVRSDRIMATVDSIANLLTSHGAVERNSQAWPRWNVHLWPNYYVSRSYDQELVYIKNWINNRIEWMDGELGFDPTAHTRGDVDCDSKVSIADVAALIDYLLSGDDSSIDKIAADCDLNNDISIGDVTAIIDYLLTGSWDD